MQVAVSFGFGIMVLAQFVGPLSGGHINCAVSFALFIGGRVSLFRTVAYTFSQMAGATLGAFWLWSIFGKSMSLLPLLWLLSTNLTCCQAITGLLLEPLDPTRGMNPCSLVDRFS
jgi:glycerol uptake facilitator-like aquaporin